MAAPLKGAWCGGCELYDGWPDETAGNVVCNSCGRVLEQDAIVSTVEFSETNGQSAVVGQFVSSTCTRPYGTGRGGHSRYGYAMSRAPREQTLKTGSQLINSAAMRLQLKAPTTERAIRCFKLAVEHKFCQGRKSQLVAAACAYIACREANLPVMLLDISDVVGENVFHLGDCYRKLVDPSVPTLTLADPVLFVDRFASMLQLGDK
ncbi:unnamed protein product, partial [Phaeothamnion confervicola]